MLDILLIHCSELLYIHDYIFDKFIGSDYSYTLFMFEFFSNLFVFIAYLNFFANDKRASICDSI